MNEYLKRTIIFAVIMTLSVAACFAGIVLPDDVDTDVLKSMLPDSFEYISTGTAEGDVITITFEDTNELMFGLSYGRESQTLLILLVMPANSSANPARILKAVNNFNHDSILIVSSYDLRDNTILSTTGVIIPDIGIDLDYVKAAIEMYVDDMTDIVLKMIYEDII